MSHNKKPVADGLRWFLIDVEEIIRAVLEQEHTIRKRGNCYEPEQVPKRSLIQPPCRKPSG